MEPYIRVKSAKGDTVSVSASVLATLLGLDGGIQQMELCINIPAGELSAGTPCVTYGDPFPGIDMTLRMHSSDSPVFLSRSEQAFGLLPRTYLYGNGDSYIAYAPADTRGGDAEEQKDSVLVIGGDNGEILHAYQENAYVRVHSSYYDSDMLLAATGDRKPGQVVVVTTDDNGVLEEFRFDSIDAAISNLGVAAAGRKPLSVVVNGDRVFDVWGRRESAIEVDEAVSLLRQKSAR